MIPGVTSNAGKPGISTPTDVLLGRCGIQNYSWLNPVTKLTDPNNGPHTPLQPSPSRERKKLTDPPVYRYLNRHQCSRGMRRGPCFQIARACHSPSPFIHIISEIKLEPERSVAGTGWAGISSLLWDERRSVEADGGCLCIGCDEGGIGKSTNL